MSKGEGGEGFSMAQKGSCVNSCAASFWEGEVFRDGDWADFCRKSTSRSSLPNRSCSLTILMNQSGLNISSLHVDSTNARYLIVPILSFACSSPAFVIDSLEACSSRFPQAKYIGRDVYLSYTFGI
jgi:hypothetical protein